MWNEGFEGHTEECDEGKPPAWIRALTSNSLPYRKTEVNGLENCPIAIETPAAIRTLTTEHNKCEYKYQFTI